ncbi:MAG: hypothetical protein HQK52_20070, partial [Oligoflexia bacterium]|nr:hypothetical protein [Oligoflexia bacterium]
FYLGQYDRAQSYLSKVAIKSAGSERSVRSRYWLAMTALHQQENNGKAGENSRVTRP